MEVPSLTESQFRAAWERAHDGRPCGSACTHPSLSSVPGSIIDFLAMHGHAWDESTGGMVDGHASPRAAGAPLDFDANPGYPSSSQQVSLEDCEVCPPPSPTYPRMKGPWIVDGMVLVSDSEEEG